MITAIVIQLSLMVVLQIVVECFQRICVKVVHGPTTVCITGYYLMMLIENASTLRMIASSLDLL